MKSGDLKKAQENYEKARTLDPKNDNAKEMLKKIKENERQMSSPNERNADCKRFAP